MSCFNEHAFSDLYSWTDENGNKRYTTSPPPNKIPARVTPIIQKDNLTVKNHLPKKKNNPSADSNHITNGQKQVAEKEVKLAMLLIFKERCQILKPHIFDNIKNEIELWETKNNNLLSDVRNSKYYKNLSDRSRKTSAGTYDRNASKACNGVEEFFTNESSTTSYNSPENVWEAYIAYLKSGEKKNAIQCLTSIARRKYKPLIERMNDEQLDKMATSIVSIIFPEEAGESIASGYAAKASGKVGVISFIKNNGGWKIYDM